MRRVWLVIASAALLTTLSYGCGKAHYEERLDKTLERLKYEARVRKLLMPKLEDKRFVDLSIFLRAPKDLALSKTGQLPVNEGQFELDASFTDKDTSLHVLARVKLPKKAQAKGAPPAPAPTPRGDFSREVLGVLTNVYGSVEKLETPKFVEETRRGHGMPAVKFRRLIFTVNDKEVDVYTYKQENHEVALIFVYDPKQKNALLPKIELSLENFATGTEATRRYNGGTSENAEAGGPVAPM